jgi:hypothetical protein
MQISYAMSPLPKSIFLAGPTPRAREVPSWRPEALRILKDVLAFSGTVFVPGTKEGVLGVYTDLHVRWEWEALAQATVVAFWIPRHIEHMPAFTTNVEFGLLATSGKTVMGHPDAAPKMGYLDALAGRYGIPVFNTLEAVLREAVHRTEQPFRV